MFAMLINNQELWSLAHGTIDFEVNQYGFSLLRFPKGYRERFADFPDNAASGAGIRLCFTTDACDITWHFTVCTPSLRTVISPSVDAYVDGVFRKHAEYDLDEGESGVFHLPLDGENHRIELYLPLQVQIATTSFELLKASVCEPIAPPEKKWLLLGDSITQGYFCKFPSYTYTCTLGKLCDADILNQGIGGYRFITALIQPLGYTPDTVFTALGVNDAMSADAIEETIPVFFDKLISLYPQTPIVAILPIPVLQEHDAARLCAVKAKIREQAERYKTVCIIDGGQLVPAMDDFFTDGLHPSALGMRSYAMNLSKELSAIDL